MNAIELRIGNLIGLTLKEFPDNYFRVIEVAQTNMKVTDSWRGMTTSTTFFDAEIMEGIPLTPEWLERAGFEKMPIHSWKGNGQDYQPETSKTEQQDFTLWIDSHVLIGRYETYSWRKSEDDEWYSDTTFSIHFSGSYYAGVNDRIFTLKPIDTVHLFQNACYVLTGKELTFK